MKNIINQYKGLRKEIYILTFGKTITCLGAMIAPLLTLILSNKLQLSASNIASLLLIMNIIQIPCLMFSGYLADHYNKRNIIIICDLITVISYFIASFIEMSMYTVILLFIASLFAMMEHPAYDALITDLSHTHQREKAFSLTYLGANLGIVLAPTIGGLLFKNYLNLAFFIDSITTLISTLLIIFFVKNIVPVENQTVNEKADSSKLWNVLKRRKIIIYFLLCYIGIEFVYSQFQFLIPLHLSELHGDNGAIYYGMMTSLNAFIVVIGTPILTLLLSQLKDVYKIFISVLLFLISYIIFKYIQGIVPCYFMIMFIFTIGEILNALGSQPYLTRIMPSSYRGRIFSLQKILCTTFAAISQKGMGILIDTYTMSYVWDIVKYLTIFVSIMVFLLVYFDKKNVRKN